MPNIHQQIPIKENKISGSGKISFLGQQTQNIISQRAHVLYHTAATARRQPPEAWTTTELK